MKKSLSLFATHLCVCIAQDESDGGEEVALSGAIATDYDIVLGRERLNDGLVLVAVGASCQKRNPRHANHGQTYLLKPWIMICLICMVAAHTMRGIYVRAAVMNCKKVGC